MTADGVGGLTMAGLAARLGIRGPSLYKYFPSLHAVYDALFARGLREQQQCVRAALHGVAPGVATIRAAATAVVRWSIAHPALAQLLFWRPVPGFEPSPAVFETSRDDMASLDAAFADAVRLGELDARAEGPDAPRLLTVVLSGLISQQLANEPGTPFDQGTFTRLTDDAIEMFLRHHRPTGDRRADPRP